MNTIEVIKNTDNRIILHRSVTRLILPTLFLFIFIIVWFFSIYRFYDESYKTLLALFIGVFLLYTLLKDVLIIINGENFEFIKHNSISRITRNKKLICHFNDIKAIKLSQQIDEDDFIWYKLSLLTKKRKSIFLDRAQCWYDLDTLAMSLEKMIGVKIKRNF